jgi:hypothetical protein
MVNGDLVLFFWCVWGVGGGAQINGANKAVVIWGKETAPGKWKWTTTYYVQYTVSKCGKQPF